MEGHIDFYLPFSGKSEVSRVIALISAKMRPFVAVWVNPGNHCFNHVFRGCSTLYQIIQMLFPEYNGSSRSYKLPCI